jgi:hypothetical protein
VDNDRHTAALLVHIMSLYEAGIWRNQSARSFRARRIGTCVSMAREVRVRFGNFRGKGT